MLNPKGTPEAKSSRRFQLQKRSQQFIGVHNETLSVAVRINDEDCSPVGIDG
jgi:hypothetical protein